MYSATTENLLRKNGWFEGRKIRVNQLIETLETFKGEFSLINTATEFFSEFGGLNIAFYNVKYLQEDHIVFDIKEATSLLFEGDIAEEYLPLVKSKHLIPIGYWNDASKIIMIDEVGALYLGVDEVLEKLGDTSEQAFENIFANKVNLPIIQR